MIRIILDGNVVISLTPGGRFGCLDDPILADACNAGGGRP